VGRPPYRRARSSKAIAGDLYAPLIEAIALAVSTVATALARAVATVINAIRRRHKPPEDPDVPPGPTP
jgi:hypothetical protein